MENFVSTEIMPLRKLLIHSPDGGIGKIIPSKFKDWLYDDTVNLKDMQGEYDEYVRLLLYFLDFEKAKEVEDYLKEHKGTTKARDIFKPGKKAYFDSDKVIDIQKALIDILEKFENLNDVKTVRVRLVAAICAIEGCSREIQKTLEEELSPAELVNALITGVIQEDGKDEFIFPPVPNLVFTRDIGIMVKDHLLLSKTAKQARKRESILAKYVALFHPWLFGEDKDKIIEITEDSNFFLKSATEQKTQQITIEGGDIMMIAPHHLIVGCSERTSASAVNAIIHRLFDKKKEGLAIDTVSVVKVPKARSQMHIDTIFTQIKKDAWVMHGAFSERLEAKRQNERKDYSLLLNGKEKKKDSKVKVFVFKREDYEAKRDPSIELEGLEALLRYVSRHDFGVRETDVKIIYSGNGQFPYDEREQWTDSCNLLALKEGVVIGYDRNEKTADAFREHLGFEIIHAKDLLNKIENEDFDVQGLKNTLILLASSELSRARGGSHCMSMPLIRDKINCSQS